MITLTLTGDSWGEIAEKMREYLYPPSLQQLQTEPQPICDEPNRRKFKILTSPYSDINPGDVAVMMEEKDDGYALCFDQLFSSADKPDVRTKQTRIIFFKKEHVEEIK